MKQPLVLIILDGWGYSKEKKGNTFCLARIPNFTGLWEKYPHTTLTASGEAVGLPEGQMGNSEVGHLNIGAGRVVYQDITRIKQAIRSGEFFKNPLFQKEMEAAARRGAALHLMGLLSDGGVHSHLTHLYALLEMAASYHLPKVFIHAFLDGRDVPPQSAAPFAAEVEDKCRELGVGRFATIMGRYYAMDRDKRWERVEKAYRAIVAGEGERFASFREALHKSYTSGVTDEFVVPAVIADGDGQPEGRVKPKDLVIFYNFRADRARELTRAFTDHHFEGFERPGGYPQVRFVCMTQYDATIEAPAAFPPQRLTHTLGEVIAEKGLRQLRIAETEKYAHVTFFFNGGVETPNPGEERILIPSPRVATYDLQPEMSAYKVTDTLLKEIAQDKFDLIILNFANPDMVGHTGVLSATIKGVEAVDDCLGRIVKEMAARKGISLVTADHGNAEEMLEPNGDEPHTAHTTNPVPFILVSDRYQDRVLRNGGSLQDIAPTILELLALPKPAEMTGSSLLLPNNK